MGASSNFRLPVNGLAGQIVINNLDLGGTWDGTVTVGATTLSGPGYTQTAASLGGGSAGVAGFDLHEESCDPVGGDDFSVFALPPELRLRHYGPVAFTGSMPVEVFSRPIGCGTFSPVSFTGSITADPSDQRSVLLSTDDGSGGTWLQDGNEYEARPVVSGADAIVSDVDAAVDPAVQNYVYSFEARCDGDVDGDGMVAVPYISYITFRLGDSGCGVDGDADYNGAVEVPDTSYVIFRLGTMCADNTPSMPASGRSIEGRSLGGMDRLARADGGGGAQESTSPGGSGLRDAFLLELGFQSVEDFALYVESIDTQEEEDQYLADVLAAVVRFQGEL